jgi:hypothetical protein
VYGVYFYLGIDKVINRQLRVILRGEIGMSMGLGDSPDTIVVRAILAKKDKFRVEDILDEVRSRLINQTFPFFDGELFTTVGQITRFIEEKIEDLMMVSFVRNVRVDSYYVV